MTRKYVAILVANGALIFLIGMLAGFPLAFSTVAGIEDGSQASIIAADVRGWKMAHLEGILNGILLISVASVLSKLALNDRAIRMIYWGLLVTSWGNITASILSPITGGRGLSFTGLDWNTLAATLFAVAVVGVFLAMTVLLVGAGSAWKRESNDVSASQK